jgi:hypothetical protein
VHRKVSVRIARKKAAGPKTGGLNVVGTLRVP